MSTPKKTAAKSVLSNTGGSLELTFDGLVEALASTNSQIVAQASKAVNIGITLRNWFFGHYIHTYEMNGADRAVYGAKLFSQLSERLQAYGISRVEERELRRYRQFFLTYPQIRESLTPEFVPQLPAEFLSSIRESVIPESAPHRLSPSGKEILSKLSFTIIAELLQIDDPLKRAFYELESIRGGWSVRELRRQIATLLYERTGLSSDKTAVVELAQKNSESVTPAMAIRDPYLFEFLGLMNYEMLTETKLERALPEKFQNFLLELGYGFCFEARQKRILIGDEYYFVDLVFYHRILKCHILIELKIDEFSHQHLGQLNTYVTWYKKNMMTEGDNPPVGILLCTKKSDANGSIVEYALAGMDNQLFVSRYAIALPKKEDLEKFIAEYNKN
ncbi:MAG: PDDEXK nuclease domain-containing protein [Syntrophomonadaceae bacterium]|jgi:predicted nuclease of restriction endonuclease-like (RecB) superfamily|nr:PDDEXK nuclease domain-containing protein [Syntrophomonadaceae bacterium]